MHPVQGSQDWITAGPFCVWSQVLFRMPPPPGFRSQVHVTVSLCTGGGPVSCMQLSEGAFPMVCPLGMW